MRDRNTTGQAAKSKSWFRRWLPALITGLITIVVLQLLPDAQSEFLSTTGSYALEMVVIFPAVLILMGLLTVFISRDFIARHLGSDSGIRGMAISFLLGTLPTGPLYMAFPLAGTLKAKGARSANIAIFLSAWACIKLPQELVEARFLGPRFMVLRLVFTVILVVIIGLIIEKAEKKG
jgi:uncharacterized membrane protein YraQ (UPF0718 family)